MQRKINLIQRVVFGLSLLSMVAVANGSFSLYSSTNNLEVVNDVVEDKTPKKLVVSNLQSYVYGYRMPAQLLIKTNEAYEVKIALRSMSKYQEKIEAEMQQLQSILTTNEESRAFSSFEQQYEEWIKSVDALQRKQVDSTKGTSYTKDQERALFDKVNKAIIGMNDQIDQQLKASNESIVLSISNSIRTAWIVMGLTLLIACEFASKCKR